MVKDMEQTILASWLMGEHVDDIKLFNPKDFEHYESIAKALSDGVTDAFEVSRVAGTSVTAISEIITGYAPSLYESAVRSMSKALAHRWVTVHKDATSAEIADAMKMFEREDAGLPAPFSNPVQELQEEFKRRRAMPFVPTGLVDLDRKLNGIRRKELTAIGARPSAGKSAFVQQVAMNVAKHGEKVMFLPLEMSALAVVERMFMRYTDISQYEVRTGLSDGVWGDPKTQMAFDEVAKIFRGGNLLIFERCNDMQSIRGLIKKHEPYMVVIDQLEQLKDGNHRWQDKRSRFSHMTHELQGLAMDMNVAVWLACQINRSADNSMPTMANLKESGSIEEDSDNVILLHREDEEKTECQHITLDLAKQRNGECGAIPLVFRANKYAFYGSEYARTY